MKLSHHLLLLTCLLAVAIPGQADDAFFSSDGKTVTYLRSDGGPNLMRVDLGTKEITEISLGLPQDVTNIDSLAQGSDGEALFLADGKAWVYEGKVSRRICDLGDAKSANHLFVAPAGGSKLADWMFVTAPAKDNPEQQIYYARAPKAKAFAPVFCRSVSVSGGVFATDGRIFFGDRADLWEGGFNEGGWDGYGIATLFGRRMAALGICITADLSDGNEAVDQVMVAGDSIYVVLASHPQDGRMLRLPLTSKGNGAPPGTKDASGVPDAHGVGFADLAKCQASVSEIEGVSGRITCCAVKAIRGNEFVFYVQGRALHLWDKKSGKVVKVADEPQ